MQIDTLTTEPAPLTARKLEKVWPRIFVVEPDYSTALTIKTVLENEGKIWEQYDVMITNGHILSLDHTRMILRQIVAWQTDIVILEYLEVPGADWLAQQLKNLPTPPVIILTSHHKSRITTADLRSSLKRQYDVDDYVRKPFNPHNLVPVVTKHWLPRTILA